MPKKTDKRGKLIGAAGRLNYEQGFRSTTLADIAQAASVPLGNVYYYFKTKDSIGGAVIELLSKNLSNFCKKIDELIQEPAVRLRAYLDHNARNPESIAKYGCQIGGLCQELAKEGGILAEQAARLLNDIISWVEAQFKALGMGDNSHKYALHFVAAIQGMNLLTLTLKDPKLLNEQSKVIITWLEDVIGTKVPTFVLNEEIFADADMAF